MDYQPSWSPDGTKILLTSDYNAYDIVFDIFMINVDGSNLNSLTGNIYNYIDYFNPVWSPNGNKIALHIVHTSGVDQYEVKLGTMNPDGNALTPIISNVAIGTNLSWSADGTRIAYTSLSTSGKDVSWVSADGLTRGTIVTNGWNADWQH
jgi:TolB protein